MGLTPSFKLRFPEQADTPDIPRDIKNLADDVERLFAPCYMRAAGTAPTLANWQVSPLTLDATKSSTGWTISGGNVTVPTKGVYLVTAWTADNPNKGDLLGSIAFDSEVYTDAKNWGEETASRAMSFSRVGLVTTAFRIGVYNSKNHSVYVSAARIGPAIP